MRSHRFAHRLSKVLATATLLATTACIDDPDMPEEDAAVDASEGAYPEQDAGKPAQDAGGRRDASTPLDGGPSADVGVEGDASAALEAGGDALVALDDAAADAAAAAIGDTYGITSSKQLILFERESGKLAQRYPIEGLGAETILGADVRPADRLLYVLSSAGKLYTVDLQSGAATLKSTLAADASDSSDPFVQLAGESFGVDFNPVADRLRVVSSLGQNLRINVDSGATTTDGALAPVTPGVRAAAYTNSFGSACRTRLFVIDAAGGKLLLQDPPNDGRLSEIGALGALGEVHGFDILTGADGSTKALVAATRNGEARVAQVDLSTGAAADLSKLALSPGETLQDILVLPPVVAPAQARGELLAISESKRLISFNRGAPAKLCTSAPITGLEGESIVGADIRPADAALYALSQSGKLFTVALDTAVATLRTTLVADATDTSEPYAGLSGDSFGVGFNPVPDRLRILSSNGQNLRVNVATGATFSDAALSPVGASVTAVAYTNSFAGARSTTLYAVDSAADALVRVGGNPASGGGCPADVANPNCGVVSVVGGLNLNGDVSGLSGFDIDPLAGTAFAALNLGNGTSSSLYSIDLSSGAATSLGAAVGGGERVIALMLAATPSLTAYALTSDDKLLAFSPATPSAPAQSLAITGLAAGEKLLGLDVRPLDGQLYTVSTHARLYRVDAATGALTLVAGLSAPGGAAIALPTSTYGLDFNPAADALRLVASSGENYRILPSTRAAGPVGTTFVDTTLSRADTSQGAPSVIAAAYTNSFAGTPSTTLYVVDWKILSLQGGLNGTPSPNGGVVTPVGAFGVQPGAELSFDIAGAHNGLSLALLSLDDVSFDLYAINLATGVATSFNAASNTLAAGGARVTGLALSLR